MVIPEGAAVYVVDDDAAMLDSMQFLLESLRIEAKYFPEPLSFLHALNSLPPGCVLTDLRMPAMSGFELKRALASREIGWPVILMSAHLDPETTADAVSCGMIEVIEKPFTASRLTMALEQAFSLLKQGALVAGRPD